MEMYANSLIILLFVFDASLAALDIQMPEWPTTYKACVYMQNEGDYIPMGWYVDGEIRRMRLDSYGIPGENQSHYVQEGSDGFDYACAHLGQPLYIFLYHYDNGKEYDISLLNKQYQQCTAFNLTRQFPHSPLLPGVEFQEQATDNYTTYTHWRAEYFLFTNDYFFHATNGLPYKVYIDGVERTFLYIESIQLEEDIFLVPKNVVCKTGTQ